MKIIKFNANNDLDLISNLVKRGETEIEKYLFKVNEIIDKIKNNGNDSLIELTKKFDRFDLNEKNFFFDKSDFEKAYDELDQKLKDALVYASTRIKRFHEKQKKNSWITTEEDGVILGQKIIPLEKIGIYVPGGKALYPSTLLMTAIPAKVAGVREIYVASPIYDFEKGKSILAAAYIAGVEKIFKIGGAQSIAAFAFGTEWIPKVDKIVGPGNIFVAMAKKLLFGVIDIDMFAGPSEILIISDGTSKPEYIANDLLSQAEHDELASAILVTTDENFGLKVKKIIKNVVKKSPRREIIEKSLNNYSAIIIVRDLDEAINIANKIAPEHLEILTKNPFDILNKIKNAGAIFLGEYSPEPIGDYVAGTNHVLPTGGTARFFSPLSVDDFYKKTSIVYVTKGAFKELSEYAKVLAKEEELIHHYMSLEVRDES